MGQDQTKLTPTLAQLRNVNVAHYIAERCTALHYIAKRSTFLYYIAQHCAALHYIALNYPELPLH